MRDVLRCALLLLVLSPLGTAAQVRTDSLVVTDTLVLADSVTADTTVLRPRTALIRSWLLPGWGQASVGSYVRGGFFVAAQGASGYMLFKTIARLNEAKALERANRTWVSDSLRTVIFTDPDGAGAELQDPVAFEEALNADPRVEHASGLVDSRSQQRQDWITATIFLTLISGVDAYVSAHLADAPVGLETAVEPDGGVRLGLRVPVGGRGLSAARPSAPDPPRATASRR